VLVPVALGLVALTGAGTYAAYQLSIPPYVETGPGVDRVEDPIPVDYTTDAGTVLDCNLYLEFRDVSAAQRARLNAMSKDAVWRGFGQRVYDALPEENRAVQDGPEPLWSERVDERVTAEALRENPGLTFRGPAGSPSLEGSTTRCEYPDADR
jgi:hypothetical protein